MNRFFRYSITFISLFLYGCSNEDITPKDETIDLGMLNLDFEVRSEYNLSLPKVWGVAGEGYNIFLDSLEKHRGMLSLKMIMNGVRNSNNFGLFSSTLPIETFAGKKIEYKGWIKTKGVKNGYAGLWFRVDGANQTYLGFDNMNNRGLTGDNDWKQVSIKMDVSKDAVAIVLGGLFPGEGTVWFDDLELYVNGVKYIDFEPKSSLSQEDIVELKKYINPLRTYEPDGGDTKDLKVLDMLIGSSKVVALGEVSHGSSEIFKMKNRIIQYLAANNGFNIFSIEAIMPEAYKVSDYTVRGEGDPKKLIASMYFWTWNTVEVLDMVEWMRKFNDPIPRIAFTGFDMQYYEGAILELHARFKGNEEAESKITRLKDVLDVIQNRPTKKVENSEMVEINSLLSFIQNCIDTSNFPEYEKNWLSQNIVVIQQYLGYNNVYWRDKCMADNVMWIKTQNPDSKLVLWAHNTHIMKTGQMMGDHLSQKLGNDYVSFGFVFFDGSFTAKGSLGLTSYEAEKAPPTSIEYILNQLDEPLFLLNLKKIKSERNKHTEWLLWPLPYRRTGAVGGTGNEFIDGKIAYDYDYLIFIKTSTPSELLTVSQ